MKWLTYTIDIAAVEKNDAEVIKQPKKFIFPYPCINNAICSPYEVNLKSGAYIFELWGSQGGDARKVNEKDLIPNIGGRGAFVSGVITLKQRRKFYLYVGGKGEDQSSREKNVISRGGYNGGGDGGIELSNDDCPDSSAAGGGSSDIRLIKDTGNTFESLKSRIIVAGAGGGACSVYGSEVDDCGYTTIKDRNTDLLCSKTNAEKVYCAYGGAAGALHGYRTTTITFTGNQTKGSFGKGGTGSSYNFPALQNGGSTGGGGSGYFGGTTSTVYKTNQVIEAGGAGGSSYVSGCHNCRSIAEKSQTNETTSDQIHYSKLSFQSIKMLSGIEEFLSPYGDEEIGHSGNGAISITLIDSHSSTCKSSYHIFLKTFLYVQFYLIVGK